MEQECFRLLKDYRSGIRHKSYVTATNCHPDENGTEYMVPAFVPANNRKCVLDRIDLANARLKWNQEMKRIDLEFQKRKYKYITIMKIEG